MEKNLFDNLDFNLEDDNDQIDVTGNLETEDGLIDPTLEVETAEEPGSTEDAPEENKGKSSEDTIDLSEFIDNENIDNNDTEIDEPSSTGSSSSPYNTFALALSEEGLISLTDTDKVETFEDLKNLVARTIKENEYAGLTDNQKTYLESLRNGIPEEEVVTTFKNIASYEKITEEQLSENDDLRVQLITQDFITKGIDETKAKKLATRSVELGEDEADAKEALSNLKAYEKDRLKQLNEQKAKEAENLEKEYANTLVRIKDTIEKTEAVIPGIPMNERVKQDVYNSMTQVVGYDQYGNPLNALGAAIQKDRENMEIKLNYLFTVTKGFSDFSVLKSSTKSDVIKELESKLQTGQLGSGKTKSSGAPIGTTLKGTLAAIDTLNL